MYLPPLLPNVKQTSPLTHSQVINIVWFIKNKSILAKVSMSKCICTIFKRKGRGFFIYEISLTVYVFISLTVHVFILVTCWTFWQNEVLCKYCGIKCQSRKHFFKKKILSFFLQLVMLKHLNMYLFMQL